MDAATSDGWRKPRSSYRSFFGSKVLTGVVIAIAWQGRIMLQCCRFTINRLLALPTTLLASQRMAQNILDAVNGGNRNA